MKTTVAIVSILLFVGCDVPRRASEKPGTPIHTALTFPAVSQWPPQALNACDEFRNASPTNRWDECIKVQLELERLTSGGDQPLTSAEVIRLLGEPTDQHPEVLHYMIWMGNSDAVGISFWLDRERVVQITRGAGQMSPTKSANQDLNGT